MENRKQEESAPNRKVHDFTELRAWQASPQLRLDLYRLAGRFPEEEKSGLAAQMRRAAVSVTANIAEGYGRFSYQENIQFCRQSRASVYELRDHLTTALDAGYHSREKYRQLESRAMEVIRLVNGYIRSTKKLQQAANSATEKG